MSKIAIKAENISKQYRLGEIGTGTISHDLNRWWHKFRGLEDPFLKIGQRNDRSQKGESDYVWSLKDINFEITQGDAVGIIGRNGAGKSTLLKLLSKVTKPTTGQFKVKGRIASLLEVGTGFHPEMTGRENIYLNGAILGMRKSEIIRKFDEIVDFADVSNYIDTPVKRYSSGMYVRLAFAVAAHLESEILIVDEVLAVGDVEFQKKCLDKMGNVTKGEGRTVLFVSHNLTSINKLCYKSMLIENGELKKFANTSEIIDIYLNRKSILSPATSDLTKSDNLQFTFKSYTVKNKLGEICNKFKFNQQIFIELEFEALNSLPKLEISLSVLNISGDTILWSNLSDSFGNNFQSFSSGRYLANIVIPENLLFEGIYFVGISCHYPGVIDLDRRLEAFSFEIFNDSTIINNAGTNLRSNFIWNYNKLV